MNKEQIEKHRDVIIWFATEDNADKGVWHKTKGTQWLLTYEPMFSRDFIYVQNDEYADFRKAQADNKIIQFINCNVWIEADLIIEFNNHKLSELRIKKDSSFAFATTRA